MPLGIGPNLDTASEVVETSRGTVEFARTGEPPHVVIFHGTPQGHHASFLGGPFAAAGFGTITPSRPGYLRTPLETGCTFPEQADAVAALLDALAIDQVAAYAMSGGGPSGIEFAARHPDRVQALILEAAIVQPYTPEASKLFVTIYATPFFHWFQGQSGKHLPQFAVKQVVKTQSTLNAADRAHAEAEILASPKKLEYLRRFIPEAPPFRLLRNGFKNDLEQLGAIERLPFEQVRCPTLVVHGTHDGVAPISHGEASAREIAGAEFYRVEKGWHLLGLGGGGNAHVQAEVNFLREHLVG